MQEIFQRLEQIDHFICIRGTGTPAQLAVKVGISERSIYDYINLLKQFGAPIKFDRERKSYYYDEEGRFSISFLHKQEIEKAIRPNSAPAPAASGAG